MAQQQAALVTRSLPRGHRARREVNAHSLLEGAKGLAFPTIFLSLTFTVSGSRRHDSLAHLLLGPATFLTFPARAVPGMVAELR